MTDTKTTIRLYYTPQVAPKAACCGPIGQTEEELRGYLAELNKSFPSVPVELVEVFAELLTGRAFPGQRLLTTFGVFACPIFAVDDEVISMGPPAMPALLDSLARAIRNSGECCADEVSSRVVGEVSGATEQRRWSREPTSFKRKVFRR